MAARTGMPTMRVIAIRLCKLVVAFTPVITKLYGGNPTLLAALATANAACAALVTELDLVIVAGD